MKTTIETRFAAQMQKAVAKYLADLDFHENGGLDAREPKREQYKGGISDEQLERYHQKWRIQKARKPVDPRPEWERFFAELAAHEAHYAAIRPQLHNFTSDAEYQKAEREWAMNASCFAPNAPGYFRANND